MTLAIPPGLARANVVSHDSFCSRMHYTSLPDCACTSWAFHRWACITLVSPWPPLPNVERFLFVAAVAQILGTSPRPRCAADNGRKTKVPQYNQPGGCYGRISSHSFQTPPSHSVRYTSLPDCACTSWAFHRWACSTLVSPWPPLPNVGRLFFVPGTSPRPPCEIGRAHV